MSKNDELPQFIRELHVGDKVAKVNWNILHGTTYTLATVTKITKTGQIEINGDSEKYRPKTGCWINDKGSKTRGGGTKIVPVTQEVLDSIEKEELVSKIDKVEFKELRLKKLRDIMAIIEMEES